MKRDYLIIAIALTVLLIITAVCVHITTIAEKDREIAELRDIRDTREYWLRLHVAALQQELQPKPYVNPLDQLWLSSGTGYRTDPMGGYDFERLHEGNDYAAAIGTPVKAFRDGIVAEHWPAPRGVWGGHPVMGGYIVVYHGDCYSKYGHLDTTFVHEGERVAMGQVIGTVGNTGMSTGPHLHFAIVAEPDFWMEE